MSRRCATRATPIKTTVGWLIEKTISFLFRAAIAAAAFIEDGGWTLSQTLGINDSSPSKGKLATLEVPVENLLRINWY